MRPDFSSEYYQRDGTVPLGSRRVQGVIAVPKRDRSYTDPLAPLPRIRGPSADVVDLRRMVLEALSEMGGVQYLVKQAKDNPKAFMNLLSKLLPTPKAVDEEWTRAETVQAISESMSPDEAADLYRRALENS